MLRSIRIAAVLVAVLAALTALPAFAAEPVWESVTVGQQSGEQEDAVMLVSGQLPADAKLPAEVELALPAGTPLQWVGEILGGPASEDPDVQYTKTTVGGMDVYRFTLTKSRIAQIEGLIHGADGTDGANRTTAIKWTAWRDLPKVELQQRIPQGAQIVSPVEGATTSPGPSGYSFYGTSVTNVVAGQPLELAFAYSAPAAAAPVAATPPAASNSGADTLVVFLLVAAFALGMGALVWSVRRKLAVKSGEEPAKPATSRAKTQSTPVSRAEPEPVDEVEEAEPDEETANRSAARKRNFAVVAVVGVLVVGVLVIASNTTAGTVKGGKITKSYGSASECSSTTVVVAAKPGVDLAKQGTQLIDVFQGQEGVGTVTLDVERSVIDIKYCESSQSDGSLRQLLSGTGLVTVQ